MKIVALSDTHGQHKDVEVPDGDVLVYAGDLMTCGRKFHEIEDFASWFTKQPHEYKVLIAGNHDRLFESKRALCVNEFIKRVPNHSPYYYDNKFYYLEDSDCVIKGYRFWGSPVQPWFYDWAFNRSRGPEIQKHWNKIPHDTDVLVTHGPPYGYGDQAWPEPVSYEGSRILRPASEHLGCEDLLKMVNLIKPSVHIFGHIHGGYGESGMTEYEAECFMMPYNGIPTKFYNVSICDEQYNPANEPIVIDLPERE